MVGYGATYAIASLSCTIGPFLAVTGAALTQSGADAVATYVAYAAGMGVIILAISVASALAHGAVTGHLRQFSRIVPRVGGALMVAAGGYAIWYGRWELGVYGGDLGSDPLIDTIEDVRLGLVDMIASIGAGRLAAAVIVVVAVIVALAWRRPIRSSRPPGVASPGPPAEPDVGPPQAASASTNEERGNQAR